MRHNFPYDEFGPVEIPDELISGSYTLEPPASGEDNETLIRRALEQPIGTKRLSEMVKPGMKITIAVDDSSRSTRTGLMLPAVLEELGRAGIDDRDITVYIALGTHRQMSEEEIRGKYTPEVAKRFAIENPDWKQTDNYVQIGTSKHGFPIKMHKTVADADFLIGVGQTIPHMIAGFGGGGKIINPGCSDEGTIGEMHWMCRMVPEGELFAVRDNAVREVIDEMALQTGLKFIINEVPGSGDSLAGVFAGDPVEAHRKACRFAKACFKVPLKKQADIVIADSYQADIDFWQALKGLNAAYGAVRDGGTVILVTPCPEGTSSQHPELTDLGYIPVEETMQLVEKGELDKVIAANLFLGRRLMERAEGVLVTKGICREDTEAMGFTWAESPQAALSYALKKHGGAGGAAFGGDASGRSAPGGPAAGGASPGRAAEADRRPTINVLYKASKMVCVVE